MAGPYVYDRVKETSTTTGTGTLTLAGAVTGFQSFAALGNGNTCYYCVEDGTNWEVGIGTYTASGTTLSRTTVLASSNSGALVSFPAGTKSVFVTEPASWLGSYFNVKAFGAKGDVLTITDGAITSGLAVLTSASNLFTAADVGKPISVKGAGAAGNNAGVANYLITTILSYQNAGQVTLSANASATVAGTAECYWGTDDAASINAATLAASVKGGVVSIPPGIYFIGTAINWYSHTHIEGAGIDTTILMLKPGGTNDIILSNGFASLTGGNTTGGVQSCSIKDLSINGWLYHGGFTHTQVNASFNSTDATLTVLSTTGFPATGTLNVYENAKNRPGEIVTYTGLTGTTFTGVARALENSGAQAAVTGDSVDLRATGGVWSSGFGLRVYGYNYVLQNIRIHDCEQDGHYSEWSNSAPALDPDGYQGHINNVKSHTNNGSGLWWKGPHDSTLTNYNCYANSLHGFRASGNITGTRFITCHSAGNQNWAWSLEAFCELIDSIGEQAVIGQCYVGAPTIIVANCRFFTDATVFSRGIVLPAGISGISYCTIDATVVDCQGGALDLSGDGGNNYFRIVTRQQQGGNVVIGTPALNSNLFLTTVPGSANALPGLQSQFSGPTLIRSVTPGTATLAARCPFTQTANVFESQNVIGTGLTVIDPNGRVGIRQAAPTYGLHQVGGSQRLAALATPGAPTVTPFPTGGGTTYTYFVVAEDIAGNKTLVSASANTTTGPASLAATTFVRITWSPVAGAIKYYILKTNNTTQLGTISPSIGGAVTQVAVTAAGSGYTGAAPAVGFSGPTTNMPMATATVAANAVTAISITIGNMGSGFTSVPTVVIGGPGSAAAATANMGVSNISTVGAGGTGYAINDTITLTGGTFATAAVLKVTAVTAGVVTAVSVQTPGSYSVLPSSPVAQGSTSGVGTGATFNVLWGVASVTVTAGGTNYSSAPSIGFNGGGALPVATAVLASNTVSGISLTSGGVGYTGAPTVVLQGMAAGSGATATASLSTLSLDDIGQSTSAFTNPLRNATADHTVDGNVIVGAMTAIGVGTCGVTTTSVSSTTTAETKSLIGTISGTFTCPANFMVVGRKLRFKAHGNITTGGTASTITWFLKFAGTTIASTGAVAPTISLSNMYWEVEVDIICRSVGGSGTFFVQGKMSKMNAAVAATTSLITWPIRGNSADPPAAVTVDTTVSSLVDFQTTTGNNLHTITCNMASLEVLN